MRKLIAMAAALVVSFPIFAQNAPQKLNPTQKVQKLFDQTNAKAEAKFQKTYPKPVAPVIESTPETTTKIPTYQQPPVPTKSYEQPAEPAAYTEAPKTPDVAVSSNDKKDNVNAPVNIFAPPTTSDNNTQNQSTPNPYR